MNTRKKKNLNLINQTKRIFPNDAFQKILDTIQQYEDIDNKTVSLVLTDDGRIRDLNRKFRGKDAVTDVISFPSQQEVAPFLGDIIIDIEVADEQKGEKSLLAELQYLFLHGLLHLLGFDHISAADELVMREKEKKYLYILKENS